MISDEIKREISKSLEKPEKENTTYQKCGKQQKLF
jgi:hypothetical protein